MNNDNLNSGPVDISTQNYRSVNKHSSKYLPVFGTDGRVPVTLNSDTRRSTHNINAGSISGSACLTRDAKAVFRRAKSKIGPILNILSNSPRKMMYFYGTFLQSNSTRMSYLLILKILNKRLISYHKLTAHAPE